MSYDVSKVIDIAKKEVGYLEKKDGNLNYLYEKTLNAGKNNYTKYGRDMHLLYPEVMDYPAAWCDCFVDWCFMKAYGVSNARKLLGGNFDDYTVASAQLYKDKNAWHTKDPKVGDQIFFKNSKRICHTGIIVEILPNSNMIVTVEGNTSGSNGVISNGGAVCRKYYKMYEDNIAGFGRPAYGKKFEYTPHWVLSEGTWYYRLGEGENAHGWRVVNHHWYYFHEKSGAMQTGLKVINNERYYLEESGDLEGACNRTTDYGALSPWYVE